MTAQPTSPSGHAEVQAARLLLARLGLSPADLVQEAPSRPPAPTFAEYVPVVSAAVSDGTRRVYGSYWHRIVAHWGQRRLDEPSPSQVEQLAAYVRTHVVARRNARGGRCAAEHLVAALRCLYNHAVADGKIAEADNPARKVAKPRRRASGNRSPKASPLAHPHHRSTPRHARRRRTERLDRDPKRHPCPRRVAPDCVATCQARRTPSRLTRTGRRKGLRINVSSPANTLL